jgi:hypothetical protein
MALVCPSMAEQMAHDHADGRFALDAPATPN